jgi:hypothetical protein
MLMEIDRWHRVHQGEALQPVQAWSPEPVPPEVEFAKKYNVEWPRTIDWTGWAMYYRQKTTNFDPQMSAAYLIDEAISIVGRTVVVTNPDQTWMTKQPFEGILGRLGGDTIGFDVEFLETEAGKNFDFDTRLTFIAPDTATAERLEMAIRKYLSGNLLSADNSPPWDNDIRNYEKVLKTSRLLNRYQVDLLIKMWQENYDRCRTVPELAYRVEQKLLERLALSSSHTILKRDNLKFVFEGFFFHNQELGVSALIAYLEVNGCTDIDFEYVH